MTYASPFFHTPDPRTRFFFALLSLGRYGVNLGFVERPIVAGAIWGALSGDMATALSLAVFYELFWLDLFPAGTYLPPNSLFPLFCILAYAGTLPEPHIAALFLPVILTLPLAFLGGRIEKRQREWQVSGYNRVILSLRSGDDTGKAAGLSVVASLAQLFLCNFAVFAAVTTLLLAAAPFAAFQGFSLSWPQASWPLLWTIGAAGGLLALRIRRNYLVFTAASLCLGVMLFV